jgi:hypothetical protein
MQLLILFTMILIRGLCNADALAQSAGQVKQAQNNLQNIVQLLKTQQTSLLENDEKCFRNKPISTLNCAKSYIQIKHRVMNLDANINYLSLTLPRLESEFVSSRGSLGDLLENIKSLQNLINTECNKKIEQLFSWNSELVVSDFSNKLAKYKYNYIFNLQCKGLPYEAEKLNLETSIALEEKAPYTVLFSYKIQILNMLATVDQFKLLCAAKVDTKNLESLLPLLQKQLTVQNFTKSKNKICRLAKSNSILNPQDCQKLPATPWSVGLLNNLKSFKGQP